MFVLMPADVLPSGVGEVWCFKAEESEIPVCALLRQTASCTSAPQEFLVARDHFMLLRCRRYLRPAFAAISTMMECCDGWDNCPAASFPGTLWYLDCWMTAYI